MFSTYRKIIIGLVLLLLFQIYFVFYYLFGEGVNHSSPILGIISLILAIIILSIIISVRRYFKKQ